jgi:single-strand DNA-binding protein
MPSYNRIELIGHLGADPETRYTPSGAAVSTIRIATTEKWKDRDSGERQERTDWHTCEAWGRTAEFMADNCYKGQLVMVVGQLRHDQYEKDGERRYFTKVRIRDLKLFQWRDRDEQRPARQDPPPQQGQPSQTTLDDDIPF